MHAMSLVWRRQPSHLSRAADDLRGSSLVIVVVGATPLFLGWFFGLGDPSNVATWLPPLVGLAACLSSLYIAKTQPSLGAALVVLTLTLGTALLAWTHANPAPIFFFVACVFV